MVWKSIKRTIKIKQMTTKAYKDTKNEEPLLALYRSIIWNYMDVTPIQTELPYDTAMLLLAYTLKTLSPIIAIIFCFKRISGD